MTEFKRYLAWCDEAPLWQVVVSIPFVGVGIALLVVLGVVLAAALLGAALIAAGEKNGRGNRVLGGLFKVIFAPVVLPVKAGASAVGAAAAIGARKAVY